MLEAKLWTFEITGVKQDNLIELVMLNVLRNLTSS